MDPELKLQCLRYSMIGASVYGLRLVLDPKGAIRQMAKNKELFEDDNDERVKFARVSFVFYNGKSLANGFGT